nr:glycosyl hydrolase family 28-related protein [Bacillus canaveralius]
MKMIYLDKKHDPRKNRALISQISKKELDIKKAIKETDELFQQLNKHKYQYTGAQHRSVFLFIKRLPKLLADLVLTSSSNEPSISSDTCVNEQGEIFPEWKPLLDEEYKKFLNEINSEVNVKDFGAAGDGITDDTEAFRKALGNGRVQVYVPEGIFITKGITLPSWTCLVGAGKGLTTIKLHHQAPKGRRLITNANHWRGNHHILVEGMSLDWNADRLCPTDKTSTWGNHSSCLTYANVTFGWVKGVEGINPGLHCFDVSSTLYNYSGDGYRARGPSKYVWLDHLNGYGFGDDGITTHHSDNILISNSHMCDPSGRAHNKGFSNSNGIEVDDGSRHVWLVNNSTSRCFGGVEIKAHHNSSAAADVQIIGHISVNDNRSYNFRHIGHHKITDPESKTAFNIRATNLVALAPIYTDLYAGSTPRALVVSAYKNVVINHFTLIGDPDYDYHKNPVIAIQYRSRNVVLNNITIRGFKKAGTDIKVFGGDNHADRVQIRNVRIDHSAPKAIDIGSRVKNASIADVKAAGDNGAFGIKAVNAETKTSNVLLKGYKVPVSVAGNEHKNFS